MSVTSRVLRHGARAALAAGIATPLLRRGMGLKAPVVSATTVAAPLALCVLYPRSRKRDVATCFLQMWAYLAHYEMPNDDPEKLAERVHVRYPVRADRAIGFGQLPGVRLQRTFATPGEIDRFERVLVWSHWVWFFVPHGTAAYVLMRRPDRFEVTALSIYAVFDLGLVGYWAVPTAPPWYAAQQGEAPELRRMMVEQGERFFGPKWQPLYSVLGGNPLAAMPSLHFATSVMAAHQLAALGPLHAAVGWTYATTLGVALVYLGEHYVIDLLAGLTLTESVRLAGPRVAPALKGVSKLLGSLEAKARPA